MKKFRKMVVSVLASAITLCSVPLLSSQAAPPPSTSPRIYIDLTVDEAGIRADVIMENVPEFRAASIGFDLGESWICVGEIQPTPAEVYKVPCTNGATVYQGTLNSTQKKYISMFFDSGDSQDHNFNGVVTSFYVEKTDNFDFADPGLSLYHGTFAFAMTITKADGTNIYDTVLQTSPKMLEADEFMYGDVTGDGIITGSDATWVLIAVDKSGSDRIRVTDLYNNYMSTIKNMKAAFAADVNKDGYIDKTDSDIILRAYTLLLSGKDFDEIDGIVGDIDVYEIYS